MVHPGKEEFLRYYPHFGITVDSSMNVEVKVTDLLQGRKFKYKSAFLGFLASQLSISLTPTDVIYQVLLAQVTEQFSLLSTS